MAASRLLRRPRALLQLFEQRSLPQIATRTLRTRPGREQSSSDESRQAAPNAQNVPNELPAQGTPAKQADMSAILAQTPDADNNLIAPVHIPEDPNAVLRSDHPATNLLSQSGIVVQRQIEIVNMLVGFEQANKYVILDPHGNHIGYIAENDHGLARSVGRQMLRTHRAFTAHVFDRHMQEVLRFHRPISAIKTKIRVYDPWEVSKSTQISGATDVSTDVKDNTLDGLHQLSQVPIENMRIIGEAHSEWAPLRRKYNLFLAHELPAAETIGTEPVPSDLPAVQQRQTQQQPNFAQFAYIDEPFLSWDFSLKGAEGHLLGSVNRNWRGLGREFFTDTGAYVLRMDSVGLDEEAEKRHIISQTHRGPRYAEALGGFNDTNGMTLDQRAVMLATAVTVDFDYFSRHSHAGGMMPMPLMMGGGAAEGTAAGGAAGAAGTAAEAGAIGETVSGAAGAAGAAGRAASAAGAGEGAMAGAGTMAGYEAMQRGLGRRAEGEDAVTPDQPYAGSADAQSPQYGNEFDPQSPQYGGGSDPQSPAGFSEGQGGDVWGSGDSDPWQEGSSGSGDGGGGDGEGGGGLISQLWDAFFGD